MLNIYWADLQIWMWFDGQNKRPLNSWGQPVHVVGCYFMCTLYLKNDQTNLNNNPKWSNQVKKSKHAKHIFHIFLVLFKAHNADGCLDFAMTLWWLYYTRNQILCVDRDIDCSKKLSFGGSNWPEKTNTTELHIALHAVFLTVVRNGISWKNSDCYFMSGL